MLVERSYPDSKIAYPYRAENGWAEGFDLCLTLARNAGSVLDLGCGTGQLAAALSPGRRVVGVDTNASLLDVARNRFGGGDVTWIEAEASTVELNQCFDFIVLTGHRFQTLDSDAEQTRVLENIARHLAPGGRFLFDNYSRDARCWQHASSAKKSTIRHPEHGRVTCWTNHSFDAETGILTRSRRSALNCGTKLQTTTSQFRCLSKKELHMRIADAGLSVPLWFGNWTGNIWQDGDCELIPYGARSL